MADAMVERRPIPRFFCHRCLVEFQDVEQSYICPYCEGGFIEQLEVERDGIIMLSHLTYSDANMSNIEDMNVDDLGMEDPYGLTREPIFNDLAFLVAGARRFRTRLNINNTRSNGTTANGATANGATANSVIANGTTANGTTANGTTANGTTANGTTTTGSTANCQTANGIAGNSTTANGTTANDTTGNITTAGDTTANGTANSTVTSEGNNPPAADINNTGNTNPPRGATLMEELLWMIGGGRPPAGAMTAGTPFVLVGTPGDYVFGGEGLDAVVTQLLGQLEHTGPPPLPRDRLASLPTEEVTEEQAATNTACSVCWENFQLGETTSRLECEHVFHKTCITPWLELHATCPICRRSLLPPDSEPAPPPPTDQPPLTIPTFTVPTFIPHQQIRLPPRIVIQRRTGPTFVRRMPSQTHTWDSLTNSSTSGSMSPASSVTAGGIWAPQTRSQSNSTGSTNSSSSLNSNDRDRQYNMDLEFD